MKKLICLLIFHNCLLICEDANWTILGFLDVACVCDEICMQLSFWCMNFYRFFDNNSTKMVGIWFENISELFKNFLGKLVEVQKFKNRRNLFKGSSTILIKLFRENIWTIQIVEQNYVLLFCKIKILRLKLKHLMFNFWI